MSVKNSIVIFIALFLLSFSLCAAGNPFLRSKSAESSTVKKENKIESEETVSVSQVSFYDSFMYSLNSLQHTLNKKVSALGRNFKDSFSFLLLIKLFFLGFIYGLIHALGPGHGKVFVTTYFSARKSKFRYGLLMGIFIAIFHVFSAVILVSLFYFVLKASILRSVNNNEHIIKLISYSIIMAIGLFMFIRQFFHKNSDSRNLLQENNLKDSLIFSIIVGIVPCPGTSMLMIFFISLNYYWLGVLIASSMAVGMAATIALIGMGVIAMKNKTLNNSPKLAAFSRAVSFISPLFIILIALILLAGELS